MKNLIRKKLTITFLMLFISILLTACGDDTADEPADNDVIVETEPDRLEGTWIYSESVDDYVILTFDGFGEYTYFDGAAESFGDYELDDRMLTLDVKLDYGASASISDYNTLIFDAGDESDIVAFEKELTHEEVYSLANSTFSNIIGEWNLANSDEYSLILNDDSSFSLSDPYYDITGRFTFDSGQLILTSEDSEIVIDGYISRDEATSVAISDKLYLYGLAGHYELFIEEDPSTIDSGVVGEWHDINSGITINFYENNTYRISPSGSLQDIPDVGAYYNDLGLSLLFMPIHLKDIDHYPDNSEFYMSLSVGQVGEDRGKLSHFSAGFLFSKISLVPDGEPPTEDEDIVDDPIDDDVVDDPIDEDIIDDQGDTSLFNFLGLSLNMEPDGERYLLEDGSNYFVTEDGSDYNTTYAEYSIDMIVDEVDQDGDRIVIFNVSTFVPNWAVLQNVRESYDYSHFRQFSLIDYETGIILPTVSKYQVEEKDGIITYGHNLPYPDGDIDIAIAMSRFYDYEVEDDYFVAVNNVMLVIPPDYNNLVIAAWPRQDTYESYLLNNQELDEIEFGTTIGELNYMDIQGALYCPIN